MPVLPSVGEEMGDERSRSGIIILSTECGRGELQKFLEYQHTPGEPASVRLAKPWLWDDMHLSDGVRYGRMNVAIST